MGSSKRAKADDQITDTIPETQLDPSEEYIISDDDAPAEETQDIPEEKKTESEPKPSEEPVVKQEEPQAKPVTPPPAEPPAKKTVPAPPPPAPVVKAADKDAGAHLVIAGNFLERANAEERVRELKKLGYSKAEVVNFELSEYHTACAGRYSDLDEARRVAKKIKDMHAIDTYVRHGN